MNFHKEEHEMVIGSVEKALAALIETKNFSEITISELVKKAGIARSTFYRNYECKEDIIRLSIRRTLEEFSQEHHPQTISERYQAQYIQEVWEYVIKYNKQLKSIHKAGLLNIYLEEINKHLLDIYGSDLSVQDKIQLFGLAGAQCNIIFNLALNNVHNETYFKTLRKFWEK